MSRKRLIVAVVMVWVWLRSIGVRFGLAAALGSVTVGAGVASVTAIRDLFRSGVMRPCRKGDLLAVLLVLGTLLARLRCGVGLKLYSEIFTI